MTYAAMRKSEAAPYATDAERYAAVAARDAGADGHFVYSVLTTGVYCRPSCPSKPARRENLGFHDTGAAAEKAGFRPCKRCRPNEAALGQRHSAAIARACRLIEAAEATPDLDALAKAAGMSRFHFHRLFKAETGVTPRAYASARRNARLRAALDEGSSVTAAIYEAGFGSNGRFYAQSGAALGMTPRAYRAGGVDAEIRFAIAQSALGAVLVAATAKGIAAILLGDDAGALLRDLQDRFPKARLVGGDAAFERMVATVIGFVEDPARGLDLPLDVRGTAFQQRVWEALRRIPAGDTASYAEIAAAIGAPKAVRAVAQACASNRIAVAIPCHRVVQSDGALSGYRWGVERKRALLERERAA